jgi:hypothetical protein
MATSSYLVHQFVAVGHDRRPHILQEHIANHYRVFPMRFRCALYENFNFMCPGSVHLGIAALFDQQDEML